MPPLGTDHSVAPLYYRPLTTLLNGPANNHQEEGGEEEHQDEEMDCVMTIARQTLITSKRLIHQILKMMLLVPLHSE